ncbi:MAG TPA: hypothetical protein VGC66_03810 [Pyrinomonadaceae bacterium]|jgi:hypothetical protein
MSKTLYAPSILIRVVSVFVCAFLLLLIAASAQAQSTDVDQPTPVTSNQVAGQITPRDIGDSRLTRHFYILTGTPGDLVMTVESKNLNGDVDLFQSGTLRPFAKVSMYAGELSTSTSKSIYLRQRETIILRVEARTPNDDKGDYRITFSGGFEVMAAPAAQPETDTTTEQEAANARRDKNTRRVSSVGARIAEPEPVETAKTAEPETSNDKTGNAPDASNKTATDNTETTTTPEPVTTARTQRLPSSRSNRRRRGRVIPPKPPETATQNNPAPDSTEEPPPLVTQPSGIEAGAKLIIETRDGMRVERFMNTVRRVTVENGQIVVFMKNGTITRHPMTNVVRMAIEP